MKEFVQAYLYIGTELTKMDRYLVNENGEIFSKMKNRKLKPRILDGYVKINLFVNGRWMNCEVHRIVASTFVENENPILNLEVNHKDGCKTNNNKSNLEWLDRKSNQRHAIENGLWKMTDEHKEKISKSNKGKIFTEEHKKNISKNHADVSSKNNPNFGKRSKTRKLSDDDIRYIRNNYKPKDPIFGSRQLAKKFGVSNGVITSILKYKTYKDVE